MFYDFDIFELLDGCYGASRPQFAARRVIGNHFLNRNICRLWKLSFFRISWLQSAQSVHNDGAA